MKSPLLETNSRRVWTTPIQKLAAEYRLSDVGMSKICRTHRSVERFWLEALRVAMHARAQRLTEAVERRDNCAARRAQAARLARELHDRRLEELRRSGVLLTRAERHARFVDDAVRRAQALGLSDHPAFVEWLGWYRELIAQPSDNDNIERSWNALTADPDDESAGRW